MFTKIGSSGRTHSADRSSAWEVISTSPSERRSKGRKSRELEKGENRDHDHECHGYNALITQHDASS